MKPLQELSGICLRRLKEDRLGLRNSLQQGCREFSLARAHIQNERIVRQNRFECGVARNYHPTTPSQQYIIALNDVEVRERGLTVPPSVKKLNTPLWSFS